jgi:hypothetical protein
MNMENDFCGTGAAGRFWKASNPDYARKRAQIERSTHELANSILNNRKRGEFPFNKITIPVVVHVIAYKPKYELMVRKIE